jgi:predicted alpha/beta-hydrolase family hydrolase
MDHPLMESIAAGLAQLGIATLRFDFPCVQSFSRAPDKPDVLYGTMRAAIRTAKEFLPGLSIFSGGRSFGARIASEAQAADPSCDVAGVVCIGFPLHPMSNPSIDRAKHLKAIAKPILIVQGTADKQARTDLLENVVRSMRGRATLCWVPDVDHSFKAAKGSRGFSHAAVAGILGYVEGWIASQVGRPVEACTSDDSNAEAAYNRNRS